jgi:hypothetical protein
MRQTPSGSTLAELWSVVFAESGPPIGFAATRGAIQSLRDGLGNAHHRRDPVKAKYIGELDQLLALADSYEPNKCAERHALIAALLDQYTDYRANLVPYLWLCQERQYNFCAYWRDRQAAAGRADVDELGRRHLLAPDQLEDDSERCDSKCLLAEFGLSANAEEAEPTAAETESQRALLKSSTLRKALRLVFAPDSAQDPILRVYLPAAKRQIVAELAGHENELSPVWWSILDLARATSRPPRPVAPANPLQTVVDLCASAVGKICDSMRRV